MMRVSEGNKKRLEELRTIQGFSRLDAVISLLLNRYDLNLSRIIIAEIAEDLIENNLVINKAVEILKELKRDNEDARDKEVELTILHEVCSKLSEYYAYKVYKYIIDVI